MTPSSFAVVLSLLSAFALLCCTDAFAFQQQQQQQQNRLGTTVGSSLCIHSQPFCLRSSPGDVEEPSDYEDAEEVQDSDIDDVDSDDGTPQDAKLKGLNSQLLDALDSSNSPVMFGFRAFDNNNSNNDKADRITKLASELEGTYVLPLEKPSEWKLLYTNAPDLLGLQGGPLSELVSMDQTVSATEWIFRLVYKPSSSIMGLASSLLPDMADDRLEQTVVFDYEPSSSNQADLRLRSTQIKASRLPFEAPALPIVGGQLLPVAVKIVFNDGDLRMDRTVQGDFLFIYQRL